MDQERKQLVVFGYGLAVISGIMAWRLSVKGAGDSVVFILIGSACGLAAVTVLDASRLKPFYKKWMAAAHGVGTLVTSAVLVVIFYGMFGLIGIVLRLLKKDLLDRKIEASAASYWHVRPPREFHPEDYTAQF